MLDANRTRRAYLVVFSDFVVLKDISDTIREHDAKAHVVEAAHAGEALHFICHESDVRVAFVEADPRTFEDTDIAIALRARGARIVLIGDAAEESTEPRFGLSIMQRPFNAADVQRHLGDPVRGDGT